MYDQDEAADRAIEMLSGRVEGHVAHSRTGKVTRFTVPLPHLQHAQPVAESDLVEAIEGEGFQVMEVSKSESAGRTRFDAVPADTETFLVERIGTTHDGSVVIMQKHSMRVVRFHADVAADDRHLALTQAGDLVTLYTTHGAGGVTGFRNRSLEKAGVGG